jgi:RimJ/RimL family protein N-acetyltransferase
MEIKLRKIEDKDLALFKKWVYQDYILRWYHQPEEWTNEIAGRDTEYSFLNHLIVYDQETPFAFCQYYDCFYAQEDWYTVNSAGYTFSIDYLIGDTNYLGKGYGKLIIAELIKNIREIKGAKSIIVMPEKENIPSCKALEANSFVYDNILSYYRLNL